MAARGTIGPYRIGLNYTVRNKTQFVTAHYFYASALKNIGLTGAVAQEKVLLTGADGSQFRLHFVGNGSNGASPLTFYNSVGLDGTWALGERTLPVHLSFDHSTPNPGERLYPDMEGMSDAAFEAKVQAEVRAILAGDRRAAATFMHFPVEINLQHSRLHLRDAAALNAQWERIFMPAYLRHLREDIPHEMFTKNGEAMLGNGALWFGAQGVESINVF